MAFERNPDQQPSLPLSREKLMNLIMEYQDYAIGNSRSSSANTSLISEMALDHAFYLQTDLATLDAGEGERRLMAVRDKAMRAYVKLKLLQIDEAIVANKAAVIPLMGDPIEKYYWGAY